MRAAFPNDFYLRHGTLYHVEGGYILAAIDNRAGVAHKRVSVDIFSTNLSKEMAELTTRIGPTFYEPVNFVTAGAAGVPSWILSKNETIEPFQHKLASWRGVPWESLARGERS